MTSLLQLHNRQFFVRVSLLFLHNSKFSFIRVYNYLTILFAPAIPNFPSSVKPDVDDVTSSSARVRWPKATDISPGLESHYHYMLWLQADGEREKNVTRVEQGAGEQRVEARITGLTFNKKYSLRVEPYREHNGEREGGASTGVVTFWTMCTGTLCATVDSINMSHSG